VSEGDLVVERVMRSGVKATTSTELIAIGFSRREEDVPGAMEMARDMLKRFGAVQALEDASYHDIHERTGLERFEALQRQALIELGRRATRGGKGPPPDLQCKADVVGQLHWMRNEKREDFVVLLADAKLRYIKQTTVHTGTLSTSVVGAREVFREAIREGASSIVVAHNHPSGDPTPSPEDIAVTKHLKEVGALLDIHVLDHVIIGEGRAVSFKESGLI
jgi:DNA repair protein RadC